MKDAHNNFVKYFANRITVYSVFDSCAFHVLVSSICKHHSEKDVLDGHSTKGKEPLPLTMARPPTREWMAYLEAQRQDRPLGTTAFDRKMWKSWGELECLANMTPQVNLEVIGGGVRSIH